jgi:hypothetical protein
MAASSFLTWRRRLRFGTNHTTRPTSPVLTNCRNADPANRVFPAPGAAASVANLQRRKIGRMRGVPSSCHSREQNREVAG